MTMMQSTGDSSDEGIKIYRRTYCQPCSLASAAMHSISYFNTHVHV